MKVEHGVFEIRERTEKQTNNRHTNTRIITLRKMLLKWPVRP